VSRRHITGYLRPGSLDEAWVQVGTGDGSIRVLSGGTDLTISAPAEVTTLVDLADCLDHGIESRDDGSIRIGAMTTLTAMQESPELADHASGVVPEMLADVGNPLLRNLSSIGGHVARGKLSDVVPVLIALDAQIGIYQGESEWLPLFRYYEERLHRTPHLVTELVLPRLPDRTAAAFLRFARTSFDFPMLNVCCRATRDGPMVTDVRIVFGATPLLAQRAVGAESWIQEHGMGPPAIETAARHAREEIETRAGWVASAEYRTHLVEVLTVRSLTEVARRLEIS
jgi:CO/xanthine dehydrogenase FAD-binding subunit